jgi:hypothetical protein
MPNLWQASNVLWFAPSGTSQFVAGEDMTRADGTERTIAVPSRRARTSFTFWMARAQSWENLRQS